MALSDQQRSEFVEFANKLADAARKEILPYWRTAIEVESKIELNRPVAESPVTIADRAAEAAMRRLIEATYPHHGIYGEEMGTVRADAEFCWVLDPIDGTKSFITGKPLFGILVALCHHGRPLIGIIDQCILDERWLGVVGHGTTLNGKPVHTRGVAALSEVTLYATTPHMFAAGHEAERFAAVSSAVLRTLYGADCYAYGIVAAGLGAHLVVEADLGLYDYAALVPVLLGAGGLITDWTGAELTLQRHGESKGRVVAAANVHIHEAAVKLLSVGCGVNGSASSSVLKPHLRELEPYKPPLDGRSSEKQLLLDFNERTVPVAPHIIEAVKAHIDANGLQQYPAYGDLPAKVAAYAGVREEECMITNGSDQGIDIIVRACCAAGTEAVIPMPTFAMYPQAALTEGMVIRSPAFTRERGFPTDEVLAAVGPATSLIVISNPNNPTGTAVARETILDIARRAPHCAILVDECYYEFMDPETSVAGDVGRLSNLFVTRTFSKTWGLPSLRFGYLMSAEANVRSLCSVRGPYDINTIAAVAVRAALAEPHYMRVFVDEVRRQAKPELEGFLQRRSIVFWPSHANFIFCYFQDPERLEAELRAKGILVRPKKDADGVLGLRVSIGTVEQTRRLVAALEDLLPDGQADGEAKVGAKRRRC